MKPIKRMLLKIARIRWLGAVIGAVFEHAAVLLPLRRIAKTRHAIAFDHPVPTEPLHRLVIPLKRVATLFDLLTGLNEAIVIDVLDCAARATAGVEGAYALEINTGARQDVMQAHFHLIRSEGVLSGAGSVPVVELNPDSGLADGFIIDLSKRTLLVFRPLNKTGTWDHRALSAFLISIMKHHATALKASRAATVRIFFDFQPGGVTWRPEVHIDRE